jgi:hypothetical protein
MSPSDRAAQTMAEGRCRCIIRMGLARRIDNAWIIPEPQPEDQQVPGIGIAPFSDSQYTYASRSRFVACRRR